MNEIIKNYIPLVEFLGKVLGPDYEIVLHDLTGDKQRIVAIANNSISGRKVGAPLTNLALKFIADNEYKHADYKVGSSGISPDGAHLYTSTLFIKSGKKLVGILCINYDRTNYDKAMSALTAIGIHMNGDAAKAEKQETERYVGHVSDIVMQGIAETANGISCDHMTTEEKMRAVKHLNKNGVFILKGAISDTAAALHVSEATIYRYLSVIQKEDQE